MDSAPGVTAEVDNLQIGLGGLPNHLRLLCVGSIEPSWLSLALQLDALGCHEPNFRWVSTANEALTLLRDESFDCLLIRISPSRPGIDDDPLSLARGIRAGGCHDPVVVVTISIDDATWTEALQLDVDLLVSAKGWESSALIQSIQRAVERGRMLHEIERLSAAERRRMVRERDEADQLIEQQRRILNPLELRIEHTDDVAAEGPNRISPVQLPPTFDDYYQELLRIYVIMGSGNLSDEIAKLAALLAQAGLTPQQVLSLHLDRVKQLVRGLGNRSTRHVMSRVDLLALELMLNLAECYQRQLPVRNPKIPPLSTEPTA
jgi:DNA-binding NarL/FixJ family response regulator